MDTYTNYVSLGSPYNEDFDFRPCFAVQVMGVKAVIER